MAMNVLLIRPPESLKMGLLQATNVTGCFPALGIAYLAAVLRDAGVPVSIIDMEAEEMSLGDDLELRLRRAEPALVGITCTTLIWPAAARIARFVKRILPDTFVAVGGPQPTIYPKECLMNNAVDAACIGEGEQTILELVEVVRGERDLKDVAGIAYRKTTATGTPTGATMATNTSVAMGATTGTTTGASTVATAGSTITLTPKRQPITDLDSIPLPAVDLLPMDRYYALTVESPFMTMVTSRGCPYKCTFCSQVYVGGKFRQRSAENVLAEFKRNAEELGMREIVIFDETFTVNKERLVAICRGIVEAGWNIRWTLRGRLDNMDEEVAHWLKKSGCYGVHMGVESGEQFVLDMMQKSLDIATIKNNFRLAREAGLETRGYFMLGYPGETRASIEKTIRFPRELGLDWASFTITVPHPACPLYDLALEAGVLTEDYWREYTIKEEADRKLPFFITDEYGRFKLTWLKWKAYTSFYLRPSLILKKLTSPRAWILVLSTLRYMARNLRKYLFSS